MPKKLKDLKIGEKSIVIGYEKKSESYREKLLSMGLTKGVEIELLKYAPLGDPVEIMVRGFKLTLRKAEAEILLLEEGKDAE